MQASITALPPPDQWNDHVLAYLRDMGVDHYRGLLHNSLLKIKEYLVLSMKFGSTMSADAPPFQQTLAKKQAAGSYLLRVNPVAVMANLSCNLETGDRSVQPKASWWGGYRVI